jgi:hypothetical protein
VGCGSLGFGVWDVEFGVQGVGCVVHRCEAALRKLVELLLDTVVDEPAQLLPLPYLVWGQGLGNPLRV